MKQTIKYYFLTFLFLFSCDDTSQVKEEVKSLCELVEDKINECIEGGRIPSLKSCEQESSQKILDSDCATVLRIIRGEVL